MYCIKHVTVCDHPEQFDEHIYLNQYFTPSLFCVTELVQTFLLHYFCAMAVCKIKRRYNYSVYNSCHSCELPVISVFL